MPNFVKFQRGTQAAYNALKTANGIDTNTLYFIYAEDNATTGSLYLGDRIISGGEATVVSTALADLTDVLVKETGTNSFLTLNAEGKWVYTSANDVANLILSARTFDDKFFDEDETGKVSVLGYNAATEGMVPTKGAGGIITWTKPASTEIGEIQDTIGKPSTETEVATGIYKDIEDLQDAVGSPAMDGQAATGLYADVATKANVADVYTKAEVDTAIANAGHLKRVVIDTLPEAATADPNTIYMVPLEGGSSTDTKAEYIIVNGAWEKIGDTIVDLSGYVTTSAMETALEGKVDVVANSRLMTNAEGTKLEKIADGAEVNVINAVNQDEFTIGENRTLEIKNIAVSKIVDLETLLNNKANASDVTDLEARVEATEAQLTWTEMTEPTTPTV